MKSTAASFPVIHLSKNLLVDVEPGWKYAKTHQIFNL